jgi:hypothetical protein
MSMHKHLIYSQKEIDFLKSNLEQSIFLKREDFEAMEELWPGLFEGITRNAYALFLKTQDLAKSQNIKMVIVSMPKRTRKPKPHKKQYNITPSKNLHSQIALIVHNEIKASSRNIAQSIKKLIEEICIENKVLKEEVKELSPYKNIVEQNYKREMCR